jgi:hypothetical protein
MRTDRVMVNRFGAETVAKLEQYKEKLLAAGMLVGPDKNGHYTAKTAPAQEHAGRVWAALGIEGPTTPGGDWQLDADAVELSKDPLLIAFQGYKSAANAMSKVEMVAAGIEFPIHTRYDELKVTGRVSSSEPNVENLPTEPGCRECFVPRKGFVFVDNDYDGLELRTLAQCCKWALGRSRLADALREGLDPHLMLAADMRGITYDAAKARGGGKNQNDLDLYLARQTGKVANFGLGGGIGWATFQKQARAKYDVILTEEQAREVIATWRRTWPEMNSYFEYVKRFMGPTGEGSIRQFKSNRIRGGCTFTEASNSFFQGLGADVAKGALYAVVRECFIGNGALRGSHPVAFVHDEIIVESPEEIGHECAHEVTRIMVEVANTWMPDVVSGAPPMLTRRLSKLAKETYRDGRLVPWEWDVATAAGSVGYAE